MELVLFRRRRSCPLAARVVFDDDPLTGRGRTATRWCGSCTQWLANKTRVRNVEADQGQSWSKMIEGPDGVIIERNTKKRRPRLAE